MTSVIHLSDNNYNKEPHIEECDIANLEHIANFKLTDKDKAGSLLVFPQSFRDTEFYSSREKVEDAPVIIELVRDNEGNPTKICTGNVMGFIGYGDTEIRIHSRFDVKDNNCEKANDFFLYHMLAKVFHVNLFNLDTTSSNKNNILDLLMVMFPQMLKDAMSQGLYKEYRTYKYNDARVRGTIEVNRFIREDIPFQGKVAYRTREFSHDNKILQLVRHTIEYMRHHPWGHGLLNNDMDTRSNVLQIVNATPTYSKRDLMKVLNDNRRPLSHPYYTKYRALQQLCVSILRHDGLQYGEEKDKVHGILFDGAWLWEEYLNTVLQPLGFLHPENKIGHGGINLFTTSPKHTIYPDFYKPGEVVADAKYKKYAETDESGSKKREVAREDLYQVITYMFRLKVKKGLILCPCSSKDEFHTPYVFEEELGEITVYGLTVSNSKGSFAEYQKEMALAEGEFQEAVSNILNNHKSHP